MIRCPRTDCQGSIILDGEACTLCARPLPTDHVPEVIKERPYIHRAQMQRPGEYNGRASKKGFSSRCKAKTHEQCSGRTRVPGTWVSVPCACLCHTPLEGKRSLSAKESLRQVQRKPVLPTLVGPATGEGRWVSLRDIGYRGEMKVHQLLSEELWGEPPAYLVAMCGRWLRADALVDVAPGQAQCRKCVDARCEYGLPPL